jgi:F-type H+-transporting ATPase subunit alpha
MILFSKALNNKISVDNNISTPAINNTSKVGLVVSVKDGVAASVGPDAPIGGLVEFSEILLPEVTYRGMVLSIFARVNEIVILGGDSKVKFGFMVKFIGAAVKVPVGFSLLGRAVDATGLPIDGFGDMYGSTFYSKIERPAPGILDRQSVCEPVHTGILLVDTLIPVGRGQRELIIGDKKTGKTAIAIDTVLNQRRLFNKKLTVDSLFAVYVATGQKRSTVAKIQFKLMVSGMWELTTIVAATASDSPALQFLSPYTGCSVGEFFRDRGLHALIIYDDLSKQAVAYRQMSLLLRRPPSREAYPGDIFYLHARLLERSTKMSSQLGSGSLTALPVIETQLGDISAYIPTNVISITDGQMFLDTSLIKSGQRPAINEKLSVSRIGAAAQTVLLKKLAPVFKRSIAQFRTVETLLSFDGELEHSTRVTLDRGIRAIELLKQKQYKPYIAQLIIILLLLHISGYFDIFSVDYINKYIKYFPIRTEAVSN